MAAQSPGVLGKRVSSPPSLAWTAAGAFLVLAAVAVSRALDSMCAHWVAASVGALLGLLLVDLSSGVVHWAFDTWGSPETPVLGRIIHSFREHHEDETAMLRHDFLETNGSTMAASSVPLFVLLLDPLGTSVLEAAVAGVMVATSLAGAATSQIHKWAHAPHVPAPIRALQRMGLLLSPEGHAAHHRAPNTSGYCITFGWWNRFVDSARVFPVLERSVAALTGARPRPHARPGVGTA